MGNKTPSLKTPVANPGPTGVFLFPNASTFNVSAFTHFPFVLRRPTSVVRAFPFPFPRPAVLSLPDPFPARPIHARRILDVETPSVVGRSDPFPDVLRRRPVRSVLPLPLSRPTVVLTVLPVLSISRRSTPTVDPMATPADGRRRPGSRPTTVGQVGRRRRPRSADRRPEIEWGFTNQR